jgi:uncharacterized protein (DUF1778 family)
MAAARLDLRLIADDKVRIAHAANLRGVPVSAFDAMPCCAKPIRLLKALKVLFRANAKLKKAMARVDSAETV